MKLASTRIVTQDVSALSRFYQAITGVTPVGNDDFVEIRTAGSVLAICSQRSVERDNASAAVAAQNRSMILEFEVYDVDAEQVRLQSMVLDWVLKPTNQPWGNRSMLFRDPGREPDQFLYISKVNSMTEKTYQPGFYVLQRKARTPITVWREQDHWWIDGEPTHFSSDTLLRLAFRMPPPKMSRI